MHYIYIGHKSLDMTGDNHPCCPSSILCPESSTYLDPARSTIHYSVVDTRTTRFTLINISRPWSDHSSTCCGLKMPHENVPRATSGPPAGHSLESTGLGNYLCTFHNGLKITLSVLQTKDKLWPLHYCNGVLCGVTAGRLDCLQSVLNATTRLVLNIPKFSHISLAIRNELHWLPVQCPFQYKICILVRNCIVGSLPHYLQELCLPVASVLGHQHLRSAGRNNLLVPQFCTVNYRLRGFSISGPRLLEHTASWHSTIS